MLLTKRLKSGLFFGNALNKQNIYRTTQKNCVYIINKIKVYTLALRYLMVL